MGLIVSICLSLTDHRSTFVTQSIVSIYLLLTQSPSAFAIRSFVKSSFLLTLMWSALGQHGGRQFLRQVRIRLLPSTVSSNFQFKTNICWINRKAPDSFLNRGLLDWQSMDRLVSASGSSTFIWDSSSLGFCHHAFRQKGFLVIDMIGTRPIARSTKIS